MNEDTKLDLFDIQGNIVKAYPRFGMPRARYVFFAVKNAEAGRSFVEGLLPLITTSVPWVLRGSTADGSALPKVTTNIAFTFDGLRHLGLPQASLQSFPEEFAMGMRARREILGDDGPSAPEKWDPVWTARDPVDIFVAINGANEDCIDERYRAILALIAPLEGGVELLSGHRGDGGRDDLPYQEASAIFVNGEPTPREHFGYTDGISNPYFKGAETDPATCIGGGKVTGLDVASPEGWAPLETGEFVLGYKDESFELPRAPIPAPLAYNGTYLVYRKLHENVESFDRYLEHVGAEYPGGKEALAAKFAGRWRNGAPASTFLTEAEADAFASEWNEARLGIAKSRTSAERAAAKARFSKLNAKFTAFDYREDPSGAGCPVGAHTRRAHPRAGLEFGVNGAFATPDALANRRRLLRRGLPYGDSTRERKDGGNHGIIFMSLGASIQRQFEFVQQQWMNYGNDFRLGNDKDPLVGNHGTTDRGAGDGRMVIETDDRDPNPPFFCSKLPRFVETRGGDYFFVPSLTALRLIADGIVDPT